MKAVENYILVYPGTTSKKITGQNQNAFPNTVWKQQYDKPIQGKNLVESNVKQKWNLFQKAIVGKPFL